MFIRKRVTPMPRIPWLLWYVCQVHTYSFILKWIFCLLLKLCFTLLVSIFHIFFAVRCWFKKLRRWCTHLAKNIWFYSYIFSFRSHLRLSSYRKFHYDKSEESATCTDLFFLVILLRFCPTHYVLRVSPSSTSLFLYHWSSTSKHLYSLFPFLSLWSSFL